MASNASPARFTRSASIPPRPPTQTTSARSWSAAATAKAGYTPPPVPPAHTNSRNMVPQSPVARSPAGHVQQQPRPGHAGQQAGTAKTEEGERVAGERQHPQQHRHVHKGLHPDPEIG